MNTPSPDETNAAAPAPAPAPEPAPEPPEEDIHLPAEDPRARRSIFVPIVVLLLLAIIAGLSLVPAYRRSYTRRAVARVRSDMRMMATAIESYYVDNMSYAVATLDPENSPDRDKFGPGVRATWSFHIKTEHAPNLLTLTTPIAYLTDYPVDPFSGNARLGYKYYACGIAGWILGSYGPDFDLETGGQLEWDRPGIGRFGYVTQITHRYPNAGVLETVYDPVNVSQPSLTLLVGGGARGAFTYDPTNGMYSAGDIWRVKQ